MAKDADLDGKTAFVTGGSSGLGKEIAKVLAAQGAHVTIFSRRQHILDHARTEILAARRMERQEVTAVSVDLSDASLVHSAFNAQPRLPDVLYCAAGGCQTQCGFLADITANDLDSCMKNNYYTAAYASQVMMKMWREQDKTADPGPMHRRIVFINSAGAFLGLPGYAAYTPSKAAVRALADTLRMEVLCYSTPTSKYTIQCAFPSNIMTDAFLEEQKNKPKLTKEMEDTEGSLSELQKKLPSATKVAQFIVASRSDFAICDSFESGLLWANMVGPSPKRGFGILDSLLAILVGLLIWPIQRRKWDSMCVKSAA